MKKAMKLITTLLVVIMLTLSIAPVALATSDQSGVNTILDQMKDEAKDTDTSQISGIGGTFVNILTAIGVVVAVIVLIVLGIKYMMGSASEKAEYKKTMIPYIVGAILIMSASFIVRALFSVFNFG